MQISPLEKPGSPTIGQPDIQATSLKVKWTAPADDGGSPITAYRVVILKSGTEIKNENVSDPGATSLSVGGLEKDTEYTVKVFARNAVFEGPAEEKAVKTKKEGKEMLGIVLIILTCYLSIVMLSMECKPFSAAILNEHLKITPARGSANKIKC